MQVLNIILEYTFKHPDQDHASIYYNLVNSTPIIATFIDYYNKYPESEQATVLEALMDAIANHK